jgi:16S rRNA G1207 methylase RsmC
MYARAREEQADTLADEIAALADEEPRMVVDDKGVARIDSAWVQWQKNRVEARKWVAAKLKPKKWGERIQVAGDADSPVKVEAEVQADKLLQAILANAQMTRQADGE